MDSKLVAWARSVKAAQGKKVRKIGVKKALPVLWLFTDAGRLADPLPAIRRLPRGLCGVVFRHDGVADRVGLARAVAAVCRERRLALSVAGDWRVAALVHAGLHLRGGRRAGCVPRWCRGLTSSAHGGIDLMRARRVGAGLAFLSPVFATASHAGAAGLGAVRWARMARGAGMAVAALGGIDGATVRRVSRRYCAGAGAIGALGG